MDVSIQTAQGEMPAYLSTPLGCGPWPGAVVIHDAAGMTRDLHNQADWLTSESFLAPAPDLFYWGGRWTCLFSFIRDWAKPLGDLDAARAWLVGRNDCTGRTGSTRYRTRARLLPGAGHGFLNDQEPDDLSRLDKVTAKLAPAGFHEPSARDARMLIIAFFRAYLADAPAKPSTSSTRHGPQPISALSREPPMYSC